MIQRLRIQDTDQFVDIIDQAFRREFKHVGGEYKVNKLHMKVQYAAMRLLQSFLGTVRNIPDIFAYYEGGQVMGITKMIPVNARKDHWYTEMTAVNPCFQKKGAGTALKEYTVEYYTGKARRFFGNLRAKNVASLKANTRVGYKPYEERILLTKTSPTPGGSKKIEGFRPFRNDEKGVYDLYVRTTPENVISLEDKTPEDFGLAFTDCIIGGLEKIQGKREKRYVVEQDGKICAYFRFEPLWENYENLEMIADPHCEDLVEAVNSIICRVSPHNRIVSYIPEYRDFEKMCLTNCGFEQKDTYLGIVRVFKGV